MTETGRRFRFEQFFATRRLTHFTPSPDGETLLFIGDISGQFNLWRVSSAGGWPDQLTLFEKESVREAMVSRAGKIAFVADTDGNEYYQVYLMDAVGGWPERVTDRPDVQYQLGGFSPDGRLLAYSGADRVPHEVDLSIRDLESGEVRQISPEGGRFYGGRFDPEGRRYLGVDYQGNTDLHIWLFDLTTGESRNLTGQAGQPDRAYPLAWRKDGQGFYYLSNAGREFSGVAYYDLQTGESQFLITPDWDVETAALSGDGKLLAYSVNEAGNSAVYVRDLVTGTDLALPPMPRGVIGGLSFAGKDSRRRLFLSMSNYGQANTIYVADLEQEELRQITQSMLGNIPAEVFVEPELVHIRSFDGLQVPAWLYRPRGATADAPVPALLAIHGGPEAQERPNYAYGGFFQYLLSQGVAVLAPNIRGSTGFGMAYQKRIHRDWGGAELKDIEACAHHLRSLDWVDGNRLGVWGGSFGGFATLSAATRLPDLWKAACDFCGPSNLITFAKSVPEHWKASIKAWVGDPDEDREMLLERSPITYVEQLTCPLMVVQGATDPRVVKAESDQMVETLRSMGREVVYLVFDDEGHGFTRQSNRLKGYGAMADFLIKQLR